MSPISHDDLHRIFKNLDKNNKGIVNIEELHLLLEKIGVHTTSEELEKFVGKTSLDYIDFFFFYEAMVKAKIAGKESDEDSSDDLSKAFKVFDLNGDGYITCDELQSVLSRLGLWEKRSGQDCKDMIRVYDENLDGVLDFEEFKNMMSASSNSENI
ncbi:hypothetical protein ACP275_03G100000 [Erythranthe tilingii]